LSQVLNITSVSTQSPKPAWRSLVVLTRNAWAASPAPKAKTKSA